MAGSYPDIPANRMLLDRDGSTLFTLKAEALTALDPEQVKILANESADDLGATTDVQAYLLAFPEGRDVSALHLGFVQADANDWVDVTIHGSRDTSDGFDGIWSELYPSNRVQQGTTIGWWGHVALGDYRRYIRVIPPATGLRALAVVVDPKIPGSTSWRLRSLHCFGVTAYEANPHRLEIWHPWLNQRVPGGHFDWGNAPFSSSAEKSFRVANLSYSKTARSIVVTVDALTDATPSVPPQMYLSYADSPFTASVTIPQLAPGARSGVVTIRRVTPVNAAPGPWAQRVLAGAGTWVALP
jgi:hypothetical protein